MYKQEHQESEKIIQLIFVENIIFYFQSIFSHLPIFDANL